MNISEFLLDHHSELQRLCKHLTAQKDRQLARHIAFQDNVIDQYIDECSKVITDYVTKNSACNTEEVMLVLESMDLEGFLS